MSTTNNPSSLLYQLRSLVPIRPLTQFEAYRLAELQANRLLQTGQVEEPGTPDELITRLPFLSVIVRPDLPVSGLTRWVKPRWQIYLNQAEPAVRRRYSLCHELKHVLDHGVQTTLYPTSPWSGESDERAERVCDYFAATLLMPKRIVKSRFFEGLHDPGELAAEFGVSPQAMRIRLEQLKLIEPLPRCDRPLRDSPIDVPGYFRQAPIERWAA